jgi:heme exporter protein A
MLDINDVGFDYQEKPLLKKVTFHLPAGGLLHLRGANGAGKTTLLKLIAGLHQPSSGQIKYLGSSIYENLRDYQRNLCFVGHKTGINPYLSLRENCLFDIHYGTQKKNITQLASLFKLENHLESLCGVLSAGQRRQAGLLRLWLSDTKLWLLDEPLVALDEFAIKIIMDKIEEHRSMGGAVLLTSHQSLPLFNTEYQEFFL